MDADADSMRLSGATSALRSTIARWTSMAQFAASTTQRQGDLVEPDHHGVGPSVEAIRRR
jgi:hypothetical protein